MPERARIGILVGSKGRGSNMTAIAQACATGELEAVVHLVVGSSPEAPALARARDLNLHVAVVPPGERYGTRLVEALRECSLVCLAGYLRLLPKEVLLAFPNRVLNIHPALLPKYGGKGMYGMHVHEAVVAAGDRQSGCTVHYVSERYDEGEVIVQRRIEVSPEDTAEDVASKVLQEEHLAYVEAIKMVIRG